MRFNETPLAGAFVIDTDAHKDDRGAFYRNFCARELNVQGLPSIFVQSSISRNNLRGTLRGMHWQSEPHAECKLVRCVRGSAYDVIVDLRRDSPTFCRWFAMELSEENNTALYIPAGFAHGFQTLADNTDLLYQMTDYYSPDCSVGARWNDPAFGIQWPIQVANMSKRDATFRDFS